MNIKIETLEQAFQIILKYLKESGAKSIEVDRDFYWEISEDERYDPYKNPQDFSLGQISSDLEHIQKIANGSEEPIAYSLVWLASILRYLGEK
jgi:hypothetical protein